MRVYLTGGSGLLGSHVAERLKARGDEVVCLQRKDSDVRFLESLGCRVVEGNVRDGPELLERGMRGVDAVVHAAALVYVGGPWPRLRAVNVEGTTHVLKAAVAAGVSRAVHISSVAVYGAAESADEAEPLDAPLAPGELYARSKREAEAAAVAAAAGRLHLAIVRPASLYGERDRLLTPRIARTVRLPVVPLMGPGDNTLPVVYAGNAAHAVEQVLDRAPSGAVYNVGLDHPLTQRALMEGMAEALGRKVRFVPLPVGVVRRMARFAEALSITVPGAGDLTVERVARLSLGQNPYGSERLRSELDWQPPFTLQEAFRRTADWLKHREERA